MEQYDGSGETFWPNGKVRYTGGFSANQYEGRGTLYGEDGTLLYDGNFASGAWASSSSGGGGGENGLDACCGR